MFQGTVFFALLLSVAFNLAFSQILRCTSHSDCDDGNDLTLDYCQDFGQLCFNVPKQFNKVIPTTYAVRRSRGFLRHKANAVPLTREEQAGILEYVIFQQREIHPHRDLHLTFLKVDILPELIALKARVLDTSRRMLSNTNFHDEIIRILNRLDDLHSQYFTPVPLRQQVSFLPFSLAEFYVDGDKTPHFVISDIVDGALTPRQAAEFTRGVQVLRWNGVPIFDAVLAEGDRGFGNNRAAKLARGVSDLTNTAFALQRFRESRKANILFKKHDGTTLNMVFKRIYFEVPASAANTIFSIPPDFPPTLPPTSAGNIPTSARTVTSGSFPSMKAISSGSAVTRELVPVSVPFGFVLRVEKVVVNSGTPTETKEFGLIRIFEFNVGLPDLFFEEFKRLLQTLPQEGVVIDIRNNRGGDGAVCQRIPQLFTNSTVNSAGAVYRLTSATSILATNPDTNLYSPEGLQALIDTNKMKIMIGDQFSAFNDGNLTTLLNAETTYKYPGPVILLTSATSYSCSDVITANFLDTQPPIGRVIGVHNATGGGGGIQIDSPRILALGVAGNISALQVPPPGGIFTRFNALRLERTGFRIDKTFEWFGVKPDQVYYPTKKDAVEDEVDLAVFLEAQLSSMA